MTSGKFQNSVQEKYAMTQDSIFVHGRVINFHSLFLVYRGYLPWIKSYISVVRLIRYSMYGV